MKNVFYRKSFIHVSDLTREAIDIVLGAASNFKHGVSKLSLANYIIASCFFEPSTRTRLSFEAAACRLQARIIGFSGTEGLSIQKGESFSDTMRMMAAYADLIVLRHPLEGAAILAAELSDVPVINAGDGANQHPTQALVDLFTIQEAQGRLDGLEVGLMGDLRHSRTVHSLLQLCKHFDMRLYFIATPSFSVQDSVCDELKKSGVRFSFHQQLDEVIHRLDVIYLTRVQTERLRRRDDATIHALTLTNAHLLNAKPHLKILHPLPRREECPPNIDGSKHAFYFQQAANGVPVRQALLSLILHEDIA